ncbi:MAG: hypothetical protein LUC32_07165 [Clostridiales bacterium]|nr:hypothetical protein [Clostridiales bacterium]
MSNKEIRLLRADEIECRIGMASEKGLSLLLYKDARADMKILVEVSGTTGRQRRHEVIGGNLYCTVSIWDEDKAQWIEKMDVGTESYTEKEKGQASDSFKRACVSLGIGRELYTAPYIWVGASKARMEQKGNKWVCYDKFRVAEITYNDNREIMGLAIVNQDGTEVYRLRANAQSRTASVLPAGRTETAHERGKQSADKIQAVNRGLERTGIALDVVLGRYGVSSIETMDDDTYRRALNSLKRTKAKAA